MGAWEAYQFPPSFVLGFHGCDASIGEAILRGEVADLKPSENDYDWLGTGIYFWESNPQRALDFAIERSKGGPKSKGIIKKPFVLGAIINLGFCLDMCDSVALSEAKDAYSVLYLTMGKENIPSNSPDLKLRRLDCAVINTLHEKRKEKEFTPYDTVRANFWEGNSLYENAGFLEEDHVQICVRTTAAILGYFRPVER